MKQELEHITFYHSVSQSNILGPNGPEDATVKLDTVSLNFQQDIEQLRRQEPLSDRIGPTRLACWTKSVAVSVITVSTGANALRLIWQMDRR